MLLTGFEGCGGRSLNPAEEVAKALTGAEVAGETVESRLLPVDHRELRRALRPRPRMCGRAWFCR